MSVSLSVPMRWLSLAASMTVFNKSYKVVTFQLMNYKKYKLTKKQFARILKTPNTGQFYEVTNEQVVHTFNELVHQPPLKGLSLFRKTVLPCIWNFLFSIFLCCLTSRSSGLDKAKLEVYAMIARLYYDRDVDFVT